MEIWKRTNHKLAYEWRVLHFEEYEVELPEYVRGKEHNHASSKSRCCTSSYFREHIKYFKYFISFFVILLLVIYIHYYKLAIFPNLTKYNNNFLFYLLFDHKISVVVGKIICIIIYRLYINLKVFPHQELQQIFAGDG
jgi:hypothetical protein